RRKKSVKGSHLRVKHSLTFHSCTKFWLFSLSCLLRYVDMAVVLLQVLERTELNKLPKGIQNKLEKFVTELQNANEALKTQHERLKADSEQQYFDIEKRLAEGQEQMLSATKELQTLKEENKKLSEFSHLFYYITKLVKCLRMPLTFWLDEFCVFKEDMKRLNENLAETNKVRMELQLKLDEIQSSAASVQHREKRMEQEKELLEKKIEWLTAELKTKTEELLNTERDKGNEILELQANLKSRSEQVMQKKQELLQTSTPLVFANNPLFKRCSRWKVTNKALEKKVSESEEQKTRLEAELKEKIKKMEKELENAAVKAAAKRCVPSLTEDQLNSMCPSAAAIAAIVKPDMKFFDLYNAYAECQTQLQLEKQETKRVSRVLDEIVHEVESKAPVLKRQREEYESMQRSMASLCSKLEQARAEIYSLQKEKEEAKQHCDELERDKLKTERQLEDASSQLCALLVELEEARGNQVSKSDGSSADISSTSEDAGSSPLTFRSVVELQRQNQSLLGRLRDLEEEKDKQQSSVDKLQKEVELLREQRNQQKQLADSSARQRDMFKTLLTQSTGFSLPTQGDHNISSCLSRPSLSSSHSLHSSESCSCRGCLSDAFTLYKKEKAENDRMLNETNDRLQKQLTELRSSHAKLTSQLEFSNRRYEMLQETLAAYRREIAALQERNHKMIATTQQQEHIIHTMSHELRQATEKLALEEVRVENITKERDMIRQAETRLCREKEATLAEQCNQKLLLTNIKSIQLSMERTETETRQRLNNRIEHLEKELVSMKARIEQEVSQRHALGRTMDAQLLEAKKQLETQNTLQQKTRELLRSSEQQVAALKAQLASASFQPSQSEQEQSELKGLLRSAEEQSTELAEQLKTANSTVEQYRSVVLALEDSLKKEKEVFFFLNLYFRLCKSSCTPTYLYFLLHRPKLQAALHVFSHFHSVQVCELQRSLKASQTEQQEALERAAAAVTQEQKAIQDSLLQTKLAAEAQGKYERELMLHAADVEALQQLKKTSQQHAARIRQLEEELKKTDALLQEKTAALNAVEKQLKENLANQIRRCDELGKQNNLLHQQMDEMAAKSRLQQQQQQQQQQQLDLSFSEEEKTTEQILEILRFVRREKEIALAQCEAYEGEALRHKQRVEHQDRELKELQEALNSEREKMQLTTKTLAQQQEQLKRMESINALQETNKMLKMDRNKLEQELQQAQAKVTKLQSDISPLQNSLSLLSEKSSSLQADKRLLEEDLKRCRNRIQQLISQQKTGDSEERQKLTSEREAQQKRISQLVEEAAKLKTELARSNAGSNSAHSQIQALKDSMVHLMSERDTLKKDLEAKNNDIQEKNKTITQVKKIGRRYKTQFEELKAQHDKLVNCLCFFLQLAESKSREEQLKQQMAEKEEKTKKAIVGAKAKISAKEKLSQEVEELKQTKEELEVRMNALKSQYEGRILRLERELRETQAHSDSREEPQDQSGAKVHQQRQISLKSPAQDRGSSSLAEPPTANIRPTTSTPSPSNKPSTSSGSKATPRASIRPMVTPATVPTPTPTATVMPTTQAESQESLMSAGASVHSTSSSLMNTQTSISQPTSTQATAFVQPTQQQATSQDAGSSTEVERPSTSSSLAGTGEEHSASRELPDEDFPVLAAEVEEDSVSQSVPYDQSSQGSAIIRDVIVIDTDSESRESKEGEQTQEGEGEEEEAEGEESVSAARCYESEYLATHFYVWPPSSSGIKSSQVENPPLLWVKVTLLCLSGEGTSGVASESEAPRDPTHLPPGCSSSHLTPSPPVTSRLLHIRRPRDTLLPQLNIQPPAPELGPPHSQRQYSQSRRTSAGRGPQLTPGIGAMPFFDEDDRMVPSTPTLVVPHRTDGFAEAIHSPQVSHLPISFRFGAPEDLLPQTSASHSDLGQLASHGGLGLYESPLFLAAHDEDGGGRSVPTTPLQVAAPMTVFTETLPSDTGDNMASQSVPMVTASTEMVAAPDDGDEVFMEQEGDGGNAYLEQDEQPQTVLFCSASMESSLESMESTRQPTEGSSLPSTSQDPGNLLCLLIF
uniref:Nucleoprotein TPR n=1 Tax=Oryzias sinensis TaxID=183150 RepID=A0A8C7YYH4_9TELE